MARQVVEGTSGDGAAASGNPVMIGGSDGTNAVTLLTDAGGRLQNDAVNTQIEILASGARTIETATADQTNTMYKGVVVSLNVTLDDAGAAGLTINVQGKTADGAYYNILTSAAVAAVGTTVYSVYAGMTELANLRSGHPLPVTWRVLVEVGDANAMTYSLSADLIR
jgi:hypothetical protein